MYDDVYIYIGICVNKKKQCYFLKTIRVCLVQRVKEKRRCLLSTYCFAQIVYAPQQKHINFMPY